MSGGGESPDPAGVPARVHDVGLQAERTRLAWGRTALAMAVIGALELHVGRADLSLIDRLPGVGMLLAAVGCWAYGGRRYLAVNRALAAGRSVAGRRQPAILAMLVALPVAFGLWSILV